MNYTQEEKDFWLDMYRRVSDFCSANSSADDKITIAKMLIDAYYGKSQFKPATGENVWERMYPLVKFMSDETGMDIAKIIAAFGEKDYSQNKIILDIAAYIIDTTPQMVYRCATNALSQYLIKTQNIQQPGGVN